MDWSVETLITKLRAEMERLSPRQRVEAMDRIQSDYCRGCGVSLSEIHAKTGVRWCACQNDD